MTGSKLRYLVLDVLKPRNPPLPEFTAYLGEFASISKVDVSLVEMDATTESLKVVIEGEDIGFDELREHIEKQGATIHSVDQVVVEKRGKHAPKVG